MKLILLVLTSVVLCSASPCLSGVDFIVELQKSIQSAVLIAPNQEHLAQLRQEHLALLGDTVVVQTAPAVQLFVKDGFDQEVALIAAAALKNHSEILKDSHQQQLRLYILSELQKTLEGKQTDCKFSSFVAGVVEEDVAYERYTRFGNELLIVTATPLWGCRLFVKRGIDDSKAIIDQIAQRCADNEKFYFNAEMLPKRDGVHVEGYSFIDYMRFVMQVFREECVHGGRQSFFTLNILVAFNEAFSEQSKKTMGEFWVDVWPFVEKILLKYKPFTSTLCAVIEKSHRVQCANSPEEKAVYVSMKRYIQRFDRKNAHCPEQVAMAHLELARSCWKAQFPITKVDDLLSMAADVALCFEVYHYNKPPTLSVYLKESQIVSKIINQLENPSLMQKLSQGQHSMNLVTASQLSQALFSASAVSSTHSSAD